MRQSDKDSLKVIGFICLFTLVIHVANVFFRGQLNDYGLLPRHFSISQVLSLILFFTWVMGSSPQQSGFVLGLRLFSL